MNKELLSKFFVIGLLTIYLILNNLFNLDDKIQSVFYFNNRWILVDPENIWRQIFYYDIKILIYSLCAILAIYLIYNFKRLGNHLKKRIYLVFCCMIFIPLITVVLKDLTKIDCPYNVTTYGGENAPCHIMKPCMIPWDERKGKCFPAGHPSGGFALISFRMLANRRKGLISFLSICVGFVMGGYQVIRGAHYTSHVLTTLLIALITVWACEYILKKGSLIEPNLSISKLSNMLKILLSRLGM